MKTSSSIPALSGRIRVSQGSCPRGHSLMSASTLLDGERAVSATVRIAGREGMIYLNPFYGKFEYECDLAIKPGDIVDLFCPSCGVSLAVDTLCRFCNIRMFAIHLPDGGQVEGCPKVGCHNHSLTIVDLDTQLERMYVEETKIQM